MLMRDVTYLCVSCPLDVIAPLRCIAARDNVYACVKERERESAELARQVLELYVIQFTQMSVSHVRLVFILHFISMFICLYIF